MQIPRRMDRGERRDGRPGGHSIRGFLGRIGGPVGGPIGLWVLLLLFAASGVIPASCSKDKEPINDPVPAQSYIGSQACATCHGPYLPTTIWGTRHEDWLNSTHGKAQNNTPSDTTIVADSDSNSTVDFKDGMDLGSFPDWAQFTAAGGAAADLAPVLGFDAVAGTYTVTIGSRTFDVEKIVGIGRTRQLYLARLGASLYVLPALYDVTASAWSTFIPENWYVWNDGNGDGFISPGETVTGGLYGVGDTPYSLGRTGDCWEKNCIGCHVTGLTSVTQNPTSEFTAVYSEDGIGCEACHGMGHLHVYDLGGRSDPNRMIVNPSNLTDAGYNDICMSCHTRGVSVGTVGGETLEYPWKATGGNFLPGEVLTDSFTPGDKLIERVHALQGNHVHEGLPGSTYGVWQTSCRVCHTAHDTSNLSLVREVIATPFSGNRTVVFTQRSGAPGSGGLMGDATDGAFTDVCEVCHTRTQYLRNDPSTPDTNHNNGVACTDCHTHPTGFARPESRGGLDCSQCHDDLVTAMTSGAPTTYHHFLDDSTASYPTGTAAKRCLSCHADHDIFRPDINPQGGRGKNLRTDIAVAPTASADFTNTDFLNTGSGGICLSCHTQPLLKAFIPPDGSTSTVAIPFPGAIGAQVAAFGASPHGGTFTVASSFSGTLTSTFDANCSKCHNDTLSPKSSVDAQNGSIAFGNHESDLGKITAPLGAAAPTDPAEETFCFRCHSQTTDAIGGTVKPAAGRDWYDAADMAARAEGIYQVATTKANVHPIGLTSGVHTTTEGAAWNWNPAGGRHVECADCHNPHAVGPMRFLDTTGTFAQPNAPSNLAAGGPLEGGWGVDVPVWPALWTTPDPATEYQRVDTSTYTWQVCLKCHSGYAYGSTPPAGQTDQALEFNPNNASYHAVIGPSKVTFPPATSFVSPWVKDSPMHCYDCHTNDTATESQGPHGSSIRGIIAGSISIFTGQPGTEDHLCFKCHSFNVYGAGGTNDPNATGFSGARNLHVAHADRGWGCLGCHAAIPHGWQRRALLVLNTDPPPYNGGAQLNAADVPGWPASGTWIKNDCANAACH